MRMRSDRYYYTCIIYQARNIYQVRGSLPWVESGYSHFFSGASSETYAPHRRLTPDFTFYTFLVEA